MYLVLPLVLHKQTRTRISSRTQLLQWIQANQHLLIGFARRTKELVVITNEALAEFAEKEIDSLDKKAEKAKEITEDQLKDLEDETQKLTDKFVAEIDAKCESKSKDILTV